MIFTFFSSKEENPLLVEGVGKEDTVAKNPVWFKKVRVYIKLDYNEPAKLGKVTSLFQLKNLTGTLGMFIKKLCNSLMFAKQPLAQFFIVSIFVSGLNVLTFHLQCVKFVHNGQV